MTEKHLSVYDWLKQPGNSYRAKGPDAGDDHEVGDMCLDDHGHVWVYDGEGWATRIDGAKTSDG
jgi:hypothetical protein